MFDNVEIEENTEIKEDDLFEEFNKNVAVHEPEAEPEKSNNPFDSENDTINTEENPANKLFAKTIINSSDAVLSFALGEFVAKNNKYDKYKISSTSKNEITDIIQQLIPSGSEPVSPIVMLFIAIFAAVTPSVTMAIRDRKTAQIENEYKQLKKELKILKEAKEDTEKDTQKND